MDERTWTLRVTSTGVDENRVSVRRLWDDTLDRLPLVTTLRDVVDLDVRLSVIS